MSLKIEKVNPDIFFRDLSSWTKVKSWAEWALDPWLDAKQQEGLLESILSLAKSEMMKELKKEVENEA